MSSSRHPATVPANRYSPTGSPWIIPSRPPFTLDGYRITRNLGVVRGIMVRSRSIFGTVGGSLQTLFGGNISLFTSLCEKTRNEAFDLMLAHAQQVGANAVVGIRYDATEIMSGVTEVLCYGTAVVVERSA